jgi:hypothetical protein
MLNFWALPILASDHRRSHSALARREINPDDTYARLGWFLIPSTVAADLLDLYLEHRLPALFGDAAVVAIALTLNGADL